MMNTVSHSNQTATRSIAQVKESQAKESQVQSTSVKEFDLNLDLLQGVIEGLPDGILILSEQREVLYQNSSARRIVRQLSENLAQASLIPHQIWRRCQALIDSRSRISDQAVVIEEVIKAGESVNVRIRVRWLDPDQVDRRRLLVTLEDQCQSNQYRAIAEAHRFNLTDRETQVWVLKHANLTYKAIAAKLYIAEDTVKKHIKSIHAKRDAVTWLTEEMG